MQMYRVAGKKLVQNRDARFMRDFIDLISRILMIFMSFLYMSFECRFGTSFWASYSMHFHLARDLKKTLELKLQFKSLFRYVLMSADA